MTVDAELDIHTPVSNPQRESAREGGGRSPARRDDLDLGQFPDVYEARGRAARLRIEAILGDTDERVRVRDTTVFPWSATASLLITAADGSNWIGTGWFISPLTLVTAGHCVFIQGSDVPARNGWAKKIQVIPGRNRDDMPFGFQVSTLFHSVKGWTEQGLESCDYGAIVLPSPLPIGARYFDFSVKDDAGLTSSTVTVGGYPGDKEPGTLWSDQRSVSSVTQEKVFYAADTMGGQSGACVFVAGDGGAAIGVAVHAYGGQTANSGTRIHAPVAGNLQAWTRP